MFVSRSLTVATAAAGLVLGVAGAPVAGAAPASDDRGFVDSTARCDPPAALVEYGRTASSRIAICKESDGDYQYRGVRLRDGARLVTSAESDGDGGFVADHDGASYTVTSSALRIDVGGEVIRDEPMVEFHKPNSLTDDGGASSTGTGKPVTGSLGVGSSTESSESSAPTTPLPPPLPAEEGFGDAQS